MNLMLSQALDDQLVIVVGRGPASRGEVPNQLLPITTYTFRYIKSPDSELDFFCYMLACRGKMSRQAERILAMMKYDVNSARQFAQTQLQRCNF